MATTWTRTFTSVLTIGQKLAEEKKLEKARDLMNSLGENNTDNLTGAGVRLEETDEAEKMDTIIFQWKEIMPKLVDVDDSGKISEIIGLLNEYENTEKKREVKFKMK